LAGEAEVGLPAEVADGLVGFPGVGSTTLLPVGTPPVGAAEGCVADGGCDEGCSKVDGSVG